MKLCMFTLKGESNSISWPIDVKTTDGVLKASLNPFHIF